MKCRFSSKWKTLQINIWPVQIMAVSFVDEGAEMMEKSALDEKQLLLSGEVCCPLRNISLFMKNRIPLPLVFCFCISGLFQAVEADMPGKNMELYQSWRCPASPAFLFACKNKY